MPGITAIPFEDNMRYFNVIISGPDDSPYEAGVFSVGVIFTRGLSHGASQSPVSREDLPPERR